jgi:hypothetical protein
LWRKRASSFTSVQRLVLVLCIILGTMTVNALFYGNKQSMAARCVRNMPAASQRE